MLPVSNVSLRTDDTKQIGHRPRGLLPFLSQPPPLTLLSKLCFLPLINEILLYLLHMSCLTFFVKDIKDPE